jgi:hypothetical protein
MPCATCEHDPRCQDVCQHSSCATGQAEPEWRCFHCDYVATNKDEARAHFGDTMTNDPTSCLLAKLEAKERIIDQLLAKLPATPSAVDEYGWCKVCGHGNDRQGKPHISDCPRAPDVGKAQAPSPLPHLLEAGKEEQRG